MTRLNGLTHAELAVIGDAALLATAVNAELSEFMRSVRHDHKASYTDAEVHALVDARLNALPKAGPVRKAIQQTYELLLVIIDGGVADSRSRHELTTWIEGDGSAWGPGFRPEKVVA